MAEPSATAQQLPLEGELTDNRPMPSAEIHARALYWRRCSARACGRWMVFVQTRAGARMPFVRSKSPDQWTPHFWDCPESANFSSRKERR